MKAVILAAGKGTRMYPLTLTTPKLLTKILNRPLLDYFVDGLEKYIDELIIVTGDPAENPLQAQIQDYAKNLDVSFKISFAIQKEKLGTAHALMPAKDFVSSDEDLLVMYGDDYYPVEDFDAIMNEKYAAIAKEVADPEKWGIFKLNDAGNIEALIEKPSEFVGNLGNIGMYKVSGEIFEYFEKIEMNPIREEYELTDMITLFAQDNEMKCISSMGWQPVGYPWHVLEAQNLLKDIVDYKIEGEIEENVVVKGRLKLGKGSVIKSGTYIEGDVVIGENCVIGPNAYLRGVVAIGNGSKVNNASEVKNAAIGENSRMPHFGYFGDGIMGNNVNFAAHCAALNLRNDGSNIKTDIKGKLVDTGLRKFSTVIGDDVKLSAATIIYPGRKIWPGKSTLPGDKVTKDLKD